MPKAAARFRISLKDNSTGEGIKVELIEAKGLGASVASACDKTGGRRQS